MPTATLSILLSSLLVLTLLMVLVLTIFLIKSSNQNRQVFLNLLTDQVSENQALRNQLLSKDPYVLNALNAATLTSNEDDEYVPSHDEALAYEQRIAGSEYRQTGLDDDLNAAGWDPITVPDNGGTPVTFRDDS